MSLFDTHRPLLDQAMVALADRGHWTPFPEPPASKAYGETAQRDGQAAVARLLGQPFALQQPGEIGRIAPERSPWGVALDVSYPHCTPTALVAAARAAEPGWQPAGPEGRIGVLLEALMRLHRRSHEIAHAVMLTTGQGPMMAFQAGGPHAQDRALEAIAVAWRTMAEVPATAMWTKPQGKNPALVMRKHYEIVGRGVALVIGCSTFPTWNTYPGLFAALATGNPVIVKPHPHAVLPAALTVKVLRETLAEQGLDPNIVTLAISDDPADTQALATHPAVRSIDFTGSPAFGHWLLDHARQARVYAEMAGLNTVLIESTDDYAGLLRNLAFSLCLYSGQMCTTPQNLWLSSDGLATDQGHVSFEQFGIDLAAAVDQWLVEPKVAFTVLGAIGSATTLQRLDSSEGVGRTVLASRVLQHPEYPRAALRTPRIAALQQADAREYEQECFGPVAYLIGADSGASALQQVEQGLHRYGALTLSAYSTDEAYLDQVTALSLRTRVSLSINLTQGVYVNQSAGFSDYHASGGNPAANASYTTAAFLADRFVVVQRRRHA